MRNRTLLVAALLVGGCSTVPSGEAVNTAPAAQALPAQYGHFPAPTAAVTIGPNQSLLDLLASVEEVTGLTFTADAATRTQLEATSVGIGREVTVPPESVYAWAGGLLLQNRFVLGDLTGREPRLVGVYGGHSSPPMLEIALEDLPLYAHHPGLIVQTTLHLEHVDVRTLGNSMRALSSDARGTQGIIPVGNTNSVLLSGPVRQVTELVTTLERINAEAGAKQESSEG